MQPVIKPVVALAGDVVELGPEAVVINGQRLPGSSAADADSLGLALPHSVWGGGAGCGRRDGRRAPSGP
ncbi:MAG: hypothetical protein DMD96_04170 [Candidatus Rokuibacteriota bacterium]|nr:MAG: hypothetical protein DMD96_04170 [Candidatus Rokubacteria bacterium]